MAATRSMAEECSDKLSLFSGVSFRSLFSSKAKTNPLQRERSTSWRSTRVAAAGQLQQTTPRTPSDHKGAAGSPAPSAATGSPVPPVTPTASCVETACTSRAASDASLPSYSSNTLSRAHASAATSEACCELPSGVHAESWEGLAAAAASSGANTCTTAAAPPPQQPAAMPRTSSAHAVTFAASDAVDEPQRRKQLHQQAGRASAAATAAAAAAAAAAAPRVKESTLLATSPILPPVLRRETWRLSDFDIEQKLHEGYASQVFKARCVLSGVQVALKVYDLRDLHEINQVQLVREVELHSSIVHSNVVAMYAAFQEAYLLVLVQEWCEGGDLHNMLRKQRGRMSEVMAVQTVLQPLLEALVYLHGKHIAHRDIKPDNLLLSESGVLKLADFGLAINLKREPAVTQAGTLDYMAPEVLVCPLKARPEDNKREKHLHYDSSVDAWSVGVLAYELLAGFPPFATGDRKQTTKRIMEGQVSYPKRMSEGARSFLESAMAKMALDRATVMELSNHPWMKMHQRRNSTDESISSLLIDLPCSTGDSNERHSARAPGPQLLETPAPPVRSKTARLSTDIDEAEVAPPVRSKTARHALELTPAEEGVAAAAAPVVRRPPKKSASELRSAVAR